MPRYKRSRIAPIQLEKKTIKTVAGFLLIALSLLLVLSFFTSAGALLSLKENFFKLFGTTVVFVPILAILVSFLLLSIKSKFSKLNVIFGSLAAILVLSALIAPASEKFAGVFGAILWQVTKGLLSPIGAFFVLFIT